MVTNSFFCFAFQILHFGAFVLCIQGYVVLQSSVHLMSTVLEPCSCCSCRAWSLPKERERKPLLPLPLVYCYLYFMGRTVVFRVENSFSQLLSKMNFWICEMSCGNSGREIFCRTQGDNNERASCRCWRTAGTGRSLKADLAFCLCTADLVPSDYDTPGGKGYHGHSGIHVLRINNFANWFHS